MEQGLNWKSSQRMDVRQYNTSKGNRYIFSCGGIDNEAAFTVRMHETPGTVILATIPTIGDLPQLLATFSNRTAIYAVEIFGNLEDRELISGSVKRMTEEARNHRQKELSVLQYYGLKEE